MDIASVLDIERPHPQLLKLYFLRCLVFPPLLIFALPFFFFRYRSLRYAFDEEGVTMSWGVLFRKEISLSYARIQDIHLTSGLFQRWLGLADLHIQTASGSAKAEMTIEGLVEFETVRDFLYSKMRGVRSTSKTRRAAGSGSEADVPSPGVPSADSPSLEAPSFDSPSPGSGATAGRVAVSAGPGPVSGGDSQMILEALREVSRSLEATRRALDSVRAAARESEGQS